MPRRLLFGPVAAEFAEHNQRRPPPGSGCLTFGPPGQADLTIGPGDTWESVRDRCRPDGIILYLPYTTVPACLWSAPVPLIAWAGDWNLLFHSQRHWLRRCDLVLTDMPGVEVFTRAGIPHVQAAQLFACQKAFVAALPAGRERDIDILFVGNLHPAVQRTRLSWLGRLARLGDRRRVVIRSGAFGAEYRELLARARVVFNHSIRGEANLRAFEAAAAGALLFQEAGNWETPAFFRDRQECVYYTADNLEELLEYYLGHGEERRALAEAARACLPRYSFERQWEDLQGQLDRDWDALAERARRRPAYRPEEHLAARLWQALGSSRHDDPALVPDLARALESRPQSADLHNALGLALTLAARGTGPTTADLATKAAEHFQRAVECDPGHLMAGLNLVEALAGAGQTAAAVEHARRTLAVAGLRPGARQAGWLDAGHFPPAFDLFRVEWERAAWANAGRPAAEARAKQELVRRRLHTLLADLTGELSHYHEAAVARPDLATTRAALGCALGRLGRPAEAVPHLSFAVEEDPFDTPAARALSAALGEVGDVEGQKRLAHERRLLNRATGSESRSGDGVPVVVPALAGGDGPHRLKPALRPGGPRRRNGDEEEVRGQRDDRGPAAGLVPLSPKVSLCVIAKNEEANLPACLEWVAGLVDEVVVVDTGSTDRTREVAARLGAKVFDFPWIDSFAAARNESLRRATGRWAFWLDADDRLDPANRDQLRALFAGLPEGGAAYVMKCLCLPDPGVVSPTVVDHLRLFPNHPELRWSYRVHEQILPAVRRLRLEVLWSDVVIHHTGYQESGLRRRKLERDLRLLGLEDGERPDDPFTLFNLGAVLQELGRGAEAVGYLRRSLERSQPGDSIVRKLYALLAQCHRRAGRPAEALAACREGRGHYPDDVELLFQEALARKDLGDPAGAEGCLLRLLDSREGPHFASVDAGLRGYKARHNLAVLYQEQGRSAEAEAQWRAALAECPGFQPAWLGLGEVCLARREFGAARRVLEEAAARFPREVQPRLALSRVLLQEGRDWEAAERALRDVLRLDPGQAEARRNLAVLLKQQGKVVCSG
jgi:tetratricopeptide (TPR) repeat protein